MAPKLLKKLPNLSLSGFFPGQDDLDYLPEPRKKPPKIKRLTKEEQETKEVERKQREYEREQARLARLQEYAGGRKELAETIGERELRLLREKEALRKEREQERRELEKEKEASKAQTAAAKKAEREKTAAEKAAAKQKAQEEKAQARSLAQQTKAAERQKAKEEKEKARALAQQEKTTAAQRRKMEQVLQREEREKEKERIQSEKEEEQEFIRQQKEEEKELKQEEKQARKAHEEQLLNIVPTAYTGFKNVRTAGGISQAAASMEEQRKRQERQLDKLFPEEPTGRSQWLYNLKPLKPSALDIQQQKKKNAITTLKRKSTMSGQPFVPIYNT